MIDIDREIQFLTVDIITRLCLGEAVSCTKDDSESGNCVVHYLSISTELNTLLFSISMIPILGETLFPQVTDSRGVGRLIGLVQETTKKHSPLQDGNSGDDFVGALLVRGMPAQQLDSEAIVALAPSIKRHSELC